MKTRIEELLRRIEPRDVFAGVAAGALATLPMTAAMAVGNLLGAGGPPRLRSLPPTRAGKRLSRFLALSEQFRAPARTTLGLLAHVGIGASAGALFETLRSLAGVEMPPTKSQYLAGIVFGTAVWASGYAGLLPTLGLVEEPDESPRGQTATMLLAHWVFGTAVVAIASYLGRDVRDDARESAALIPAPPAPLPVAPQKPTRVRQRTHKKSHQPR